MADQDGENPASKVGNWLETTRSGRAVDGGDHRPMSSSGAMLNGQTFLAREGDREIRTGTKSRGRKTRTARSGADVWIKGEKERVSRSRAKTSGVPTRARYAPPKLVSWTNVYDMDSDDDRGDADRRGHSFEKTRLRTAAPPMRTAALSAVVDDRAAPPAPDVFALPDVDDDDDLPGQVSTRPKTSVPQHRPEGGALAQKHTGNRQLPETDVRTSSNGSAGNQHVIPLEETSDMLVANFERRKSRPPPLDEEEGGSGRFSASGMTSASQESSGGSWNSRRRNKRSSLGITMYPARPEDLREDVGKIPKGQSRYTMLEKIGTQKMLEEMKVAVSLSTKLDNRKNRDFVDARQIMINRLMTLLALLGLGCAIQQNEYVIGGEPPNSFIMTVLKSSNSLVSMLIMGLLYYYYMLHIRFERIVHHLRRGAPLTVEVAALEIFRNKFFWLEVLLCCSHLPPFVTFEVPVTQMKNFSMVRAETLGAVWNCLRLYLLARCFTDWILARMPKRHTVATFAAVPLGTSYAFKQLFNGWGGVFYVMASWAMLLLVSGYWFRAAEMTACLLPNTDNERCLADRNGEATEWSVDGVNRFTKENDLYIQNSVWAMLVTSTTVGYGDILPNTHFSRAVAGIMAILGIVMASLLTAALSSALQFSPQEMSALLLLQREKARKELEICAVNVIQLWWRRKKAKRLSRAQRHMNMFDLLRGFRSTKRQTAIEVEDLAGDGQKIDAIALRSKYLETAVENIADKLWEPEMLRDLAEQQEQRIGNNKIFQSFKSMPSFKTMSTPTQSSVAESPDQKRAKSMLLKMLPQSSFSNKVRGRVQARVEEAEEKEKNGGARASVLSMALGVHRTGSEISDSHSQGGSTTRKGEAGYIGGIKIIRDRALAPKKMWRRKREIIDVKLRNFGWGAAIAGLSGTLFALIQNELLIKEEPPNSDTMNILKAANSICSVATVVCLFNTYWLNILFNRVQAHLRRGQHLNVDVPYSLVLSDSMFWIEVITCLVHNPPNYTFVFPMKNLENLVVYRSETIFCMYNTLRCYLLWPVLTERVLSNLPRRHTVAMFASVHLGKGFAFKLMLHGWNAIWYIAGFWMFFMILFGYWFRAFEISACGQEFFDRSSASCQDETAIRWVIGGNVADQANNVMIYNALWVIFVTTTTVGYGDIVPTTHLSRFVCVLAAFLGIVAASLLTASLGNSMQPSAAETSATMVLHREKARYDLLILAQRIIAFWWRRRQGTLNRRQRNQDPFAMKMLFRRTLQDTQVEVDDCAGISKKIEQIAHRSKYLQRALDAIADKLWEPEVLDEMHKVDSGGSMQAEVQSPKSPKARARRSSFVMEAQARLVSRSSTIMSRSDLISQLTTSPLQSTSRKNVLPVGGGSMQKLESMIEDYESPEAAETSFAAEDWGSPMASRTASGEV